MAKLIGQWTLRRYSIGFAAQTIPRRSHRSNIVNIYCGHIIAVFEMVNSDHSEVEEDDMEPLNISTDSAQSAPTNQPTKRRYVDSKDEQDRCAKKQRYSSSKEAGMIETDNIEATWDKNGENKNNLSEEKDKSFESTSDQNEESILDSSVKIRNGEEEENNVVKVKKEGPVKDANSTSTDESPTKIKNETTESNDGAIKQSSSTKVSTSDNEKSEEDNAVKKEDESANDSEENIEEKKTKEKRTTKHRATDTEVVDGLELSVECASDKEGSSSDSSDEKETKPRPKTMIVKAEPNESELECSSEDEKSDVLESNDAAKTKTSGAKRGKRKSTRTSFSKLKASESEDSQNNNSDEDYSPRTKKKVKRSPTTKKSTKRPMESKRGRGRARKISLKRNEENVSDDDENSDTISTEKIDETKMNEAEKELSEKESLTSKSDSKSNSENEEKPKKSRKTRYSEKPESNKKIISLKKYINKAGIRVRSYQEIWNNCRNNKQRIDCLKELLEKNGVHGKPTLEKCKQAKIKREKMQEISELDTSNIISEGRVTRARKHRENDKKPTTLETPPRHREARKRIQAVIDSDSE